MRARRRPAPNSRGAGVAPSVEQEYLATKNMNSNSNGIEDFKENINANLATMTNLLKEMSGSQIAQTTEVQALGHKVADVSERLSMIENKSRMINQDSSNEKRSKNFGTDIDGTFHEKIRNVIDEFDLVSGDGADRQRDDYYWTKFAQLEDRVRRMDEALQATEEKVELKMEDVDSFVNERLNDIDDVAFENMQFPQPPQLEPLLDERPPPPPPPLGEFLPPHPPPPHPQNLFDIPSFVDDGTQYYQERSFNEPNVQPSRMQEISSSQRQQSNNSVNERSEGYHFKQKNTSFMSSFSKADNQYRRQFQPFRRNQIMRGQPQEYFGGSNVYANDPMIEEDYFYDGMHGFS